jgi:tRNA threonylcarbamoyladenosine biosynthesis protein TsaB
VKLLALETSTEACSVAVLVDAEVIERFEIAPQRHAMLILPMLDAVLAEAGLTVRQLDALAFGRGPGAFTGVRIATSLVQGIAFAADLPVAPVSTLAALAKDVHDRCQCGQVAAALDARLGEVYWGAYRAVGDGDMVLVGVERVCAPAVATLPEAGDWYGAGSGWALYGESLRARLGVAEWVGDCYPRAAAVARLGAFVYRRGECVDAERALPVYLRDEVVKKPG